MNFEKNPIILHIIHRLGVGGLENGLVNLINHMPPDRYSHVIACLTESTDFRDRIQRNDVPIFSLLKHDGQDLGLYKKMWKILRQIQPDIVHTRNISTLEHQILAKATGVPGRIHGEHGRDIYDLDGKSVKYNWLRRMVSPFTNRFITVNGDLAMWLRNSVAIDANKVTCIPNGVNSHRFSPRNNGKKVIGPEGFMDPESFVVGWVGRMEAVKDPLNLVNAFIRFYKTSSVTNNNLRLVMVGDGELCNKAKKLLKEADLDQFAWLPGERSDIPELMNDMDLFVLPSLREGMSNTILEAMACGLPVVATNVGGNSELVDEGKTGMLVPVHDPVALAEAMCSYYIDRQKLLRHGHAGRKKIEAKYSMESMVNGYLTVYDETLKRT